MTYSTTDIGIFSVGFVFGYLLYYAVKHTKEFNIEMFSTAIGAVGGGTLPSLLGKYDWIGPYGIGLLLGFISYSIVSLFLVSQVIRHIGQKSEAQTTKFKKSILLCKILLGRSNEELESFTRGGAAITI